MTALTAPRRTTAARLKPKAPAPKEQAIQAAILDLLRTAYPDVIAAAVPNGGYVMDARVMVRLKWQGLLPGFPDLILIWTGGFALVEVKTAKGVLSDAQRMVIPELQARGLAAWNVPGRARAA